MRRSEFLFIQHVYLFVCVDALRPIQHFLVMPGWFPTQYYDFTADKWVSCLDLMNETMWQTKRFQNASLLICYCSFAIRQFLILKTQSKRQAIELLSWLSFVVSNCEFVTFPLVSWVRCDTWLYRFLIFAPLLTLKTSRITLRVTQIRVMFYVHTPFCELNSAFNGNSQKKMFAIFLPNQW